VSVITLAEPAATSAPYGTDGVGPIFASVLVGARAGADWAWTRLYRALAPRVLAYLRASGIPTAEAALGDVFARAAAQIDEFDGLERAFNVWVFTIAHGLVVEERRRDEPVILDGHHIAAEARLTAELLDAEQRDVLLLAVCGDLSPLEIASVVDRPVSAVKALERKAYDQLRTRLPAVGSEEP
jgi:DNA-directed RNA polymerase specialized sigma24 family protein